MPEQVSGKKVYSLDEFVGSIQRMFDKHYCGEYWLKAEISKLNLYTKTGHCYPDLVENRDGKTFAQVSAFIHKKNFQAFNERFLSSVGEPLKDGMKVYVLCSVSFSKSRGVRLEVKDIDIDSIIGEQARNHQNSILKLKSEGVFALNRSLRLPTILKRFAVVSVETSKGYQDFCALVKSVPSIQVRLFPAQMLGNKAVAQITESLTEIRKYAEAFDAVCIIRGGGGEVALQCFNDLDLSRLVATFPLPVLTGIGHVTNKTVIEEVANQEFVSPSDLAKFLVDRFQGELAKFNSLVSRIHAQFGRHISRNANRLNSPSAGIKYKFRMAFERKMQILRTKTNSIKQKFNGVFVRKSHAIYTKASHIVLQVSGQRQAHLRLLDEKAEKLTLAERKMVAFRNPLQPQFRMVAEPGAQFGISSADKVIHTINDLTEGDVIQISTPDGVITAKVMRVEERKA